eukprot:Lankesteria_metandrocarpae@DN3818_c0_g1_i1.p1
MEEVLRRSDEIGTSYEDNTTTRVDDHCTAITTKTATATGDEDGVTEALLSSKREATANLCTDNPCTSASWCTMFSAMVRLRVVELYAMKLGVLLGIVLPILLLVRSKSLIVSLGNLPLYPAELPVLLPSASTAFSRPIPYILDPTFTQTQQECVSHLFSNFTSPLKESLVPLHNFPKTREGKRMAGSVDSATDEYITANCGGVGMEHVAREMCRSLLKYTVHSKIGPTEHLSGGLIALRSKEAQRDMPWTDNNAVPSCNLQDIELRYLTVPFVKNNVEHFVDHLAVALTSWRSAAMGLDTGYDSKLYPGDVPLHRGGLELGNWLATSDGPLLDILVGVTYLILSFTLCAIPLRYARHNHNEKLRGTRHLVVAVGLSPTSYWAASLLVAYLVVAVSYTSLLAVLATIILPGLRSWSVLYITAISVTLSSFTILLWVHVCILILRSYIVVHMLTVCAAFTPGIFIKYYMAKEGAYLMWHKIAVFTAAPYNPLGLLIGLHHVHTNLLSSKDYWSLTEMPVWCVIASAVHILVLLPVLLYWDTLTYTFLYRRSRALATLEKWYKGQQDDLTYSAAARRTYRDAKLSDEEERTQNLTTALQLNAANAVAKRHADDNLETQIVRTGIDTGTHTLVMNKICHVHMGRNGGSTVALKGLTYTAEKYDIVAFLGPNGAGKSTMINIITSALPYLATRGDVFLNNYDLCTRRGRFSAFPLMGICGQEDHLFEDLSVRSNLLFFARIKGVPSHLMTNTVNEILSSLGLVKYSGQCVRVCSGGIRRRVSTAIALVGSSELVILDEPTSGVDPVFRRSLCAALKKHSRGKTIFLTTHTVAEAETIATKVGIIVDGQLVCFDSPAALRQRYGRERTIEITLPVREPIHYHSGKRATSVTDAIVDQETSQDADIVLRFLRSKLNSDLQISSRVHRKMLVFVGSTVPVGAIFMALAESKRDGLTKAYAVYQPSLEQIYVQLAGEAGE